MTVTDTNQLGQWLSERSPVIWAREIEPDAPDAHKAIRLLLGMFDQLGIASMLDDIRVQLAKDGELNEMGARHQQAAVKRVQDARQAALIAADPEAALAELSAAIREGELWTPTPDGDSVLMAETRRLGRAALQRAVSMASGKGDAMYRRLQELAAESVEAIAVAPLPGKVWSVAEPASLTMRSDSPESWTVMLRESDRFDQVHNAAVLVRSLGGVQNQLPGMTPSSLGWRYRNWQTAQQGYEQLRTFNKALRLRYAIDNGWLPGLWTAEDINGNGDYTPKKVRLFGWGN